MGELKRLEGLIAAIGSGNDNFPRRCARVDDWRRLFDLAFEHGVAGILSHRLAAVGFRVPEQVLERAEQRFAIDRLWSRRTLADLAAVQEGFDRAGVRAVVLKGPVLAERIYPEAALRPAGDLDFLVTPAAFEGATEALTKLGFDRAPDPPTAHLRHATGFDSVKKVRVELHWQASSKLGTTLASGPLVDRSVVYRMRDSREVRILEPSDELLYLAVHAARHRFARLRWVWELGALMERCDDRALGLFVERALRAQVGRAVAVTLGVLHKRLEYEPAHDCARHLPRGLWLRAELGVAGVATDRAYRQRGLFLKSLWVVCGHTYRALLAETSSKALRHWTGAMRHSLRSLLRRQDSPRPGRL